MGCSNAILRVDPYSQTRIQFCDCSTDAVRKNYLPEYLDNMTLKKNEELTVVIRLNCNQWRMKNG